MLVVLWSGVISVQVKWPCQGDGGLQERREVVGSRCPGHAWQEGSVEVSTSTRTHSHTKPGLQDLVTPVKTGLDVRNLQFLESRATRGGVRELFSCLCYAWMLGDKTSNKSIAAGKKPQTAKTEMFPRKNCKGDILEGWCWAPGLDTHHHTSPSRIPTRKPIVGFKYSKTLHCT